MRPSQKSRSPPSELKSRKSRRQSKNETSRNPSRNPWKTPKIPIYNIHDHGISDIVFPYLQTTYRIPSNISRGPVAPTIQSGWPESVCHKSPHMQPASMVSIVPWNNITTYCNKCLEYVFSMTHHVVFSGDSEQASKRDDGRDAGKIQENDWCKTLNVKSVCYVAPVVLVSTPDVVDHPSERPVTRAGTRDLQDINIPLFSFDKIKFKQ